MKREPVTQEQIDALIRTVGPLSAMITGLRDVDLSRGRGVLEGNDRCLWTTDGKRIEIHIAGGGVIVSQSKEVDPELPPPLSETPDAE